MSTFIIPQDYSVLITEEQLGQITTNSKDIELCLEQTYEEVKEYIRHRFDAEYEMRGITLQPDNLTPIAAFSENGRFFDDTLKLHYIALQDGTNEALNNPVYFAQFDDRNKQLVQKTIDVFLYHLHTRLNPNNIPNHRRYRYDGMGDTSGGMNAIKWLLKIQQGELYPDLKIKLDEEGNVPQAGQSVIYGRSKKPTRGSKYGYFTGE